MRAAKLEDVWPHCPESTREEIIRQIEDWLKQHVTFSSFVLLYM